ncbi:hypothetical protein OS493_040248 [Desmophyllum pertusum]|uniref:Uncharacterized protein n=1 Tax=Desmophyllum pertusum TaxID=174260 RepID=A0A9W9ZHE6_9CNID|nr:hypothetical protein OS493_040248 [Desmophyllum pertusum]
MKRERMERSQYVWGRRVTPYVGKERSHMWGRRAPYVGEGRSQYCGEGRNHCGEGRSHSGVRRVNTIYVWLNGDETSYCVGKDDLKPYGYGEGRECHSRWGRRRRLIMWGW